MNNPNVTVRAESTVVVLSVRDEHSNNAIPVVMEISEALDLIAKLSEEITNAVKA